MDTSGADRRILLVQTNQVLYVDKSVAGYKVNIWQIFGRLVWRLVSILIVSVLLIYYAVSRSSFLVLGSSFLVSRFSFLGGSDRSVRFSVLAQINKIIGCFRLLARLPEKSNLETATRVRSFQVDNKLIAST